MQPALISPFLSWCSNAVAFSQANFQPRAVLNVDASCHVPGKYKGSPSLSQSSIAADLAARGIHVSLAERMPRCIRANTAASCRSELAES
jgi:hypothetical protein